MHSPRLTVDFGTSNTAAVLTHPTGRTPLLFEGSPLLPSAVYLPDDGELLVGRDAERSAGVAPERLEPNPKRRIDDGTLWLGDRELPVADAIAAVVRRAVDEAGRVAGASVTEAILTHPAQWSRPRLAVLTEAAHTAGLPDVRLVPEPVAAAAYFVTVLGHQVPVGRCIIVYDLGGGTFDAAVVRRGDTGFEVLAAAGLPDVGGLDLDAAIVGHLRTVVDTDSWSRLDWPDSPADRRARRLLWQDARAAKEQLTRHSRAELHVPLAETDVHLTRDEFETLARPLLDRTVEQTMATLRAARIGRESVAGVFLVGGASRVPLAASLLHRTLGIAPTVLDQPELVVATGAHTVPSAAGVPMPPRTPPAALTATAPASSSRPTAAASATGAAGFGSGPEAGAHAIPPRAMDLVEPTRTSGAAPDDTPLPADPVSHNRSEAPIGVRYGPPATATGTPVADPRTGRTERRLATAAGWTAIAAGIAYDGWRLALMPTVPLALVLALYLAAGILALSRRRWAGLGLLVGYAGFDLLATLPTGAAAFQIPPWMLVCHVALYAAGVIAAVAIVRQVRATGLHRPAHPRLAAAVTVTGLAMAVAYLPLGYWPYDLPLVVGAVALVVLAPRVRPVGLAVGLGASWAAVGVGVLLQMAAGEIGLGIHLLFAALSVVFLALAGTYAGRLRHP